MINRQLISPESIVVVGASEDTRKPGGKVLVNLAEGGYNGTLYAVNPNASEIHGVPVFPVVSHLPEVDLAILAIPAPFIRDAVAELAYHKKTKAFIILSAGFSELNEEGAALEKEIISIVEDTGGCMVGPNCIGVMNDRYHGVFTLPVPDLTPNGVTLISGSGATAVFIMESGIPRGLPFSAVYSMGNSAHTGVEDMVCWMDEHMDESQKPGALLLYFEAIRKPDLLVRHAASLVKKGVPVVALKAGSSPAGSRAASSHTGALAGSDEAADALFRKAGIIRCHSREEMTNIASVLMYPRPAGRNIAIVTHAGGPGVMLTDTLSSSGLEIPELSGKKAQQLLERLYPGSSVKNPVDFLATGTAGQLSDILDSIENDFSEVDASVVIFGSPGLFPVDDVYDVLHKKIREGKKPVFPVLPSVVNVHREIEAFLNRGNIFFPDEVMMGRALAKVMNTPPPFFSNMTESGKAKPAPTGRNAGYLDSGEVNRILRSANIPVVDELVTDRWETLCRFADEKGYPVVLKAEGLIHKSDAGGVRLNIRNEKGLKEAFTQMQSLSTTRQVMIQPMIEGLEIFAGVKSSGPFGHLILFGIGGIFIEVIKDYMSALVPVTPEEAGYMIRNLKSYDLIRGARGQQGIDEDKLINLLCSLSDLVQHMPEIDEMDINPLMARGDRLIAVDARIKIEKRSPHVSG